MTDVRLGSERSSKEPRVARWTARGKIIAGCIPAGVFWLLALAFLIDMSARRMRLSLPAVPSA